MALVLQASLLLRYGDGAVADAFCASRLDRDWGRAFGTGAIVLSVAQNATDC
jgi:putative acyl-CoA dehydrogenase